MKATHTFSTQEILRHQSSAIKSSLTQMAELIQLVDTSDEGQRFRFTVGLDKVFGISNYADSELLRRIYTCEIDRINDNAFCKASIELAETLNYPIGIISIFNAVKHICGHESIIRVIRESIIINMKQSDGSIVQVFKSTFRDISSGTVEYKPIQSHLINTDTKRFLSELTKTAERKASFKILDELSLSTRHEEWLSQICSMSDSEIIARGVNKNTLKTRSKTLRVKLIHLFYPGGDFGDIRSYLSPLNI